ncbi:hypothetical protein N7454_009217 [Penicillium verhagenii]|nr:hypothetical protein N7454_009217 [Penicillium verhagenii]
MPQSSPPYTPFIITISPSTTTTATAPEARKCDFKCCCAKGDHGDPTQPARRKGGVLASIEPWRTTIGNRGWRQEVTQLRRKGNRGADDGFCEAFPLQWKEVR